MKRLVAFSILLQLSHLSFAQDKGIPVRVDWPGTQFKLVGELGEKMGDTLTVTGIIVEGPYKGREGGPNLVVQMIRDSSMQNLVQIPVSSYFGKFGDSLLPQHVYTPKIKNGATYRLLVYETGEYVGIPYDAYKEAGITLQTSGFLFSQ